MIATATVVSARTDERSASASLAAIALIAGIYVMFLLFAQFGFLQGIHALRFEAASVHVVLGAMAAAGMLAGFFAAAACRNTDPAFIAGSGFVVGLFAGVDAALIFAHGATGLFGLVIVAVFTGCGLGFATVAAAILIRRLAGGRALGLHVGIGTGFAYFFCNIPPVFHGTPVQKGLIAAGAALVGLIAAWRAASLPLASRKQADAAPNPAAPPAHGRVIALVTTAFLALVWFDSAAFAVVQFTPKLAAMFWSSTGVLLSGGCVHALAAVAAGVLIDRGWFRSVLAAAFLLLVLGHTGFGLGEAGTGWSAPVYGAGVSLYSTALAVVAALAPAGSSTMAPAWRAAWVYAIAGWIGSGAGVGLAEQFHRVPAWAAPSAAVVLFGALAMLRARPQSSSIP